jgi:hypothetical protein
MKGMREQRGADENEILAKIVRSLKNAIQAGNV